MVKYALLIGINYTNDETYELKGSYNDVLLMQKHLIEHENFVQDNILILTDKTVEDFKLENEIKEHARMIPSHVKVEVWARDKGQCTECGSSDHLHFDHIVPYTKGGTSLSAENIQLLCARHNLQKSDKII